MRPFQFVFLESPVTFSILTINSTCKNVSIRNKEQPYKIHRDVAREPLSEIRQTYFYTRRSQSHGRQEQQIKKQNKLKMKNNDNLFPIYFYT